MTKYKIKIPVSSEIEIEIDTKLNKVSQIFDLAVAKAIKQYPKITWMTDTEFIDINTLISKVD